MRFSTRVAYSLKALLTLAQRYGEGSVAVSQIAKRESLPVPYLEQILNRLKKKGFVKSVRGPQGGYVLTRKPSEITALELFMAAENRPVIETPKGAVSDPDEAALAYALFWNSFADSVETHLKEVSLETLLSQARKRKKSSAKGSPTFHI